MNKLFRPLFANDQMCVTCGRWYTPETLVDENGKCSTCLRTGKQATQRTLLDYEKLKVFWERLNIQHDGDINESELVYFIRGKTTRRVKIGYTSVDAYKRMMDLQVGSPDVLELLGVVNAPLAFEQELHFALRAYRSHGEWFDSNQALLKFIKRYTYLPARNPDLRPIVNQFPAAVSATAFKATPSDDRIGHTPSAKSLESRHTRFVIFPVRPTWLLKETEAWLLKQSA